MSRRCALRHPLDFQEALDRHWRHAGLLGNRTNAQALISQCDDSLRPDRSLRSAELLTLRTSPAQASLHPLAQPDPFLLRHRGKDRKDRITEYSHGPEVLLAIRVPLDAA